MKALDYLNYISTKDPTAIVIGIDQTLEAMHSNGIATLYVSKDFGIVLLYIRCSYSSVGHSLMSLLSGMIVEQERYGFILEIIVCCNEESYCETNLLQTNRVELENLVGANIAGIKKSSS